MNNNGPCKILISSVDAYGHVNACLGIGKVLAQRGNEVYFLNKSSYKDSVEKQGIKFLNIEKYSEDGEDQKAESNMFVPFIDGMYEKFKQTSIERVLSWDEGDKNMMKMMIEQVNKTIIILKKIIEELKIDIFVGDFVFSTPFFWQSQIPFVPVISYTPLALYDGPPLGSGLSVNDDPQKWREYREAEKNLNEGMISLYRSSFEEAGLDVPTVNEAQTYAKHFGVYVYPEALDYKELGNPKSKWVRMESAVRKPKESDFEIPEILKDRPGKLIFFSLGSLGTACRKLMKDLLEILSKSPHRFIVSKGAFGDELNLPDNMWGENYVDQLAILPKVDLVITHGGNNTLVETLVAGKPMIVMPLFGDQPDNAQRVQDLGLGRRMHPIQCTQDELLQAIEDLLADDTVKEKVAVISERLRKSDSGAKVAEYIEHLARTGVSPL